MRLRIGVSDWNVVSVEIFFILSLLLFTYSSNVYIAYGFLTFGLGVVVARLKCYLPIVFLLLFLLLIPIYTFISGFEGGFRVIKSLVVVLSMIIISTIDRVPTKGFRHILKSLHYFMYASAVLVCVDFVLFFSIGKTIMNFTTSGFMPRPQGFMEDSNFFSYSMLCYIMYLKFAWHKSTKLYIVSLLCSGSMSALIMLIVMLFLYKRTKINNLNEGSRKWNCWYGIIIVSVILLHSCYYLVVSQKDTIVDYIEQQDIDPFLKIKTISMFLRFDAQKTAIDAISMSDDELFGGGPGITRTLNDRGMNLHNTYYQIYVEMGIVLILLIGVSLFYYMMKIRIISFLFLFSMMSLFGNMLEVFYSPILPFIFFLYKITYVDRKYSEKLSANTHCDLLR